jgi:heme/copper-type cytochrome/quinol oxidase subunit 4
LQENAHVQEEKKPNWDFGWILLLITAVAWVLEKIALYVVNSNKLADAVLPLLFAFAIEQAIIILLCFLAVYIKIKGFRKVSIIGLSLSTIWTTLRFIVLLSSLIGLFTSDATLSNTNTGLGKKSFTATYNELVRDNFKLHYPSNWYIDVKDTDYNPDNNFVINGPEFGFIYFNIIQNGNLCDNFNEIQIYNFQKFGLNIVSKFNTYGRLSGKGAILNGRIKGYLATVKVFAYYGSNYALLITQQYEDEDYPNLKDGFEMIENSFILKSN